MSERTHGQALYELWCDPDEGLKCYWHFLSAMEQDRWERLAKSVCTTIQMAELQHIPVEEDDEELIVQSNCVTIRYEGTIRNLELPEGTRAPGSSE